MILFCDCFDDCLFIYYFLQAMKFLYDKDFPHLQLGHVQSGNIFVVDDVCRLGGYENTLLGYRTRLFRLCKDHMQHFDIILFGKEMKRVIYTAYNFHAGSPGMQFLGFQQYCIIGMKSWKWA